jgi:hypothetical protein
MEKNKLIEAFKIVVDSTKSKDLLIINKMSGLISVKHNNECFILNYKESPSPVFRDPYYYHIKYKTLKVEISKNEYNDLKTYVANKQREFDSLDEKDIEDILNGK